LLNILPEDLWYPEVIYNFESAEVSDVFEIGGYYIRISKHIHLGHLHNASKRINANNILVFMKTK